MNRYVITTETIGGQEYRISALFDEKKRMIEVLPEKLGEEDPPVVGNIYIGRVENIVKNLNAAFLKISPQQNCYLPLEDVKHPIFTKKCSGEKKVLAAGDELLVQVVREALKTKEPTVTTNLSLTGSYAVLTSGNRKTSADIIRSCSHSGCRRKTDTARSYAQMRVKPQKKTYRGSLNN